MGKRKTIPRNRDFKDQALSNDATYFDYLERLKKLCLSMFEWVNLPKSMNARYIERCLYYSGQASLLKDENYGFINTRCSTNGYINIYGLPTKLHCYSYSYRTNRNNYTGLIEGKPEEDCVLVMNNYERIPTCSTIELFAYRLYLAQRTCDVNISGQRFPVMVKVDEKQRLTMLNLLEQYDGNYPFIIGDKNTLSDDMMKAIKTEVPFVADKVQEYKKEIWNECLTFLGINNISTEKKERLVSGEVNENNELINLNLQSYLAPRKEACRLFNELFGLEGENAIDVRVRSDLHNIIKEMESIVTDYNIDKEKIENEVLDSE